jgi:5-methylcytosine-specific restriction endonuclease McrA
MKKDPKTGKSVRDYAKEVAKYTSKPEVKKKRAEQNAARREMERAGKVHKGDGKQVDHIKPLSKGGGTGRSNLRVVPASENESFSRNSNGSLKSQVSKRERSGRR